MQKSRKTKGFTLTELAIVIAVIAILIAVLIPTFVSLINKANESADEQAVANMNTALATDEALNGKPEDVGAAADVLEAYGFSTSFETYTSGYMLKWDSTENLVLLCNSETQEVVYPTSYGTALASTGVYSLTTVVDSSDPTAGFAGGSGTETDPYLITSTNGLESLRTLIALNNTNSSASTNINLASAKVTAEGETNSKYQISVKLLRDIDLGTNWTPLGTVDFTYIQNSGSATINDDDCNPFIGEFDGNGKTITINNPTSRLDYALFSYVSGTESNPTYIHDINFIMNVTNDTAYECSAVAAAIDGNGINSVVIENITVYGEIKAEYHAGGVVGWYARSCSFINCINYADITTTRTSSYSAIGGICAQACNWMYNGISISGKQSNNNNTFSSVTVDGSVAFSNCANYGTLTHASTSGGYSLIGNIVGQIASQTQLYTDSYLTTNASNYSPNYSTPTDAPTGDLKYCTLTFTDCTCAGTIYGVKYSKTTTDQSGESTTIYYNYFEGYIYDGSTNSSTTYETYDSSNPQLLIGGPTPSIVIVTTNGTTTTYSTSDNKVGSFGTSGYTTLTASSD